MLIHLLPEQVEGAWDTIAPMLLESLSPGVNSNYAAVVSVLRSILAERSEVWAYIEDEKVYYVMLTAVRVDPITAYKYLEIYAIYAVRMVRPRMFEEGLDTLFNFTKAKGAGSIVAYSSNPEIDNIAKRLGADISHSYIRFERN